MKTIKTISINGCIVGDPAESWCKDSPAVVNGIRYRFSEFANPSDKGSVCAYTLTFDLPDSFDAVAFAVGNLEEQREELRAKFQMAVNEINDRISKLSALTNEVEA
jgi:hypothetical protein